MKYASASAFRSALEQRLTARAGGDGTRIARQRKRIAFDRLLARLVATAPDDWLLKGGFALDLRLADRARTTKDVDLAWRTRQGELIDTLIDASTRDEGDYFTFTIQRTNNPGDRLDAAHRFRVTASLAGRAFETFFLDIGHDVEPGQTTEALTTPDLLGFAGIDPVTVSAIPLASHIAEKLHAYTRIYEGGRPSTRTKDLIDLALIAESSRLDAAALSRAIRTTFAHRATHASPSALPTPPSSWRVPYRQLAYEVGLPSDLSAGHASAAGLLDPVLHLTVTSGTWDPDTRRWESA